MRGKALHVAVFDFKGRPLGTYRNTSECAKDLKIHPNTVYRLVRNGKALKRNGMTFDIKEDD